jgi:kynurenine formamidase
LSAIAAHVALVPLAVSSAAQEAPQPVSREQVTTWIDELSNWGRWGPDDELGTLNLITPEKRRAAAGLVRDGVPVSLARDVSTEASLENGNPLEHEVTWREGRIGVGLDSYSFSYHGYDFSHLDALPHFSVDGKLYNGYSTETVRATGAERLGIEVMHDGIFTRGVLMDLPRVLGVDFLEPGMPVTVEHLEAWERETGVAIEPGDVLLIRTGRWVKRAQDGPWRAGSLLAGLHASTLPWLHERDIAAIGCDGITDAVPSGVEGYNLPVHVTLLVAMGTPLFDNLDLDALAEEAAARGRWTFLFTAAPVRFPGGLGSPLNPIVIF